MAVLRASKMGDSMVTNEESCDQVWAAMPKSCLKKRGTVKPMEWVETINHKGKMCWVERPLKPSWAAQRRAHGTPRQSEKDQAGGAIGSTVLMTIISAMVLLGKIK